VPTPARPFLEEVDPSYRAERTLRLEAAGFETRVEEFVAPTVTPHNLLLCGRRTGSDVRMARASQRLATLRGQPS